MTAQTQTQSSLFDHFDNGGVLVGGITRSKYGTRQHFQIFYSQLHGKYVICSSTCRANEILPYSDHELMISRFDLLERWLSFWQGLIRWTRLDEDEIPLIFGGA